MSDFNFVSVAPYRVKGKCNLTTDGHQFISNTFSISEEQPTSWKLTARATGNSIYYFELILVSKGWFYSEVQGIIYLITLGGDCQEIKFGPQLFTNCNELLPIQAEISALMLQSCCEIFVDIHCTNFAWHNDLLFSDVILEVGGEEVKAHKVFLAARSSVFLAMFNSGLQEQQESRVKIADIDLDVVKEMLRYVYTGRVNGLENHATDLMLGADKYNMCELKNKCSNWLIANLSAEKCPKLLITADLLNDEKLKKAVIDFTVRNFSKVKGCDEWKLLTSNNPTLMEDLLVAMHSLVISSSK